MDNIVSIILALVLILTPVFFIKKWYKEWKEWRGTRTIKTAEEIDSETSERYFNDLENLCWFEITPYEYLSEAKQVLRKCLTSSYIDTTNFSENHPLSMHFEKAGFGNYGQVSLDLRVVSDDPEELSEGSICKLLCEINETFKLRGTELFTECSDNTNENGFGYTVVVDGGSYPVYSAEDEKNYNWGMGVNAVVRIIDALLEKRNDKHRLYFSWSGDNSINFFLLTEPIYEYLTNNGIGGGFGKIMKHI